MLSLASLAATVGGAPLLVHMSSPESVTLGVKAVMVGSLISFGCFTTGERALQPSLPGRIHSCLLPTEPPGAAGLLQWFVSPYLLRLSVHGEDVEAWILTVFATRKVFRFKVSDIRQPETVRHISMPVAPAE